MNRAETKTLLAALALSLGLSGCGASGSSEDGITVGVSAVAQGTATHSHDEAAAEADEHGELLKSFRRADGMKIEMQTGLLNLVPVGLEACAIASAGLEQLLQGLNPLASAQAHSGHTEGPAGAVDVILEDETVFDLGSLAPTSGTYCGLKLRLTPGSADALAGVSTRVGPCYYPDSVGLSDEDAEAVTAHSCLDVATGSEDLSFTLPFTAPVELGTDRRELALTLTNRYEEWFDGIDMSLLETDAGQQQKLLDNVVAAITVHTEDQQLVMLNFGLDVNGQEAVCGETYDGLGVGSIQNLRLEGFRYYLSDPTLESDTDSQPLILATRSTGTVYQDGENGVALMGDAQGCEGAAPLTTRSLAGTVAAGVYDRLCFTLGVPFELNHDDPTTSPSPLNAADMSRNRLSGHLFYRFDALVDPDGASPAGFFVHLGSTGCSNGESDFGSPPDAECSAPNRPRICLDYAEIKEGHRIVTDIAGLVATTDIVANTPDTAPGCTSSPGDPECVDIMPRFGLDYQLDAETLVPRQEQAAFSLKE